MSTEIGKLIETYSNAILAFVVIQSLAFAYTYGTEGEFRCLMRYRDSLAWATVIVGIVILAGSIAATVLLGRALADLSNEHSGLIRQLYKWKIGALVLFGLVPPVMTFFFGVLPEPCASFSPQQGFIAN